MQAVGHQAVAVGSRIPGGANAELPGITATTYEDVLANSAIDGIYIATPNHLHVPIQPSHHGSCPFSSSRACRTRSSVLSCRLRVSDSGSTVPRPGTSAGS
jgi:hypothetical protein